MVLCAVIGYFKHSDRDKMSRPIEYLLLITTLEDIMNTSSVKDKETASLLLFQGKTLIKMTLANIERILDTLCCMIHSN